MYKGDVNNHFIYYEDDGETFNYEKNDFYQRTISYLAAERKIVFGTVKGSFTSKFKQVKLMFHGFTADDHIRAGKALNDDFASFLTPVSRFDPQGTTNPTEGYAVKSVVLPNNNHVFEINY
ncbi:hypothetical protein D9M68_534840 [compost metagenome]